MISLQARTSGKLTVLEVAGSLQSKDNRTFADKLGEIGSTEVAQVVVNFAGLEYINSQAIADLMVFYHKLHGSGGQLALAGMQPIVDKVVRAVGLGELVTIFSAAEEAEKAWG